MAPIFNKVATETSEKASFAEVDIDSTPELAARFRVQSIPTVLVFKDGQEVERYIGATGHTQLSQLVNKHTD